MKYLVERDAQNNMIMSFLLGEDGRAVEIHADRESQALRVGDILLGRVEHVAENLRACFVELEHGVKGYLPMEEIVEPVFTKKGPASFLQQSDELVVQITREAIGSKGVSLTTRLQLKGRYVILRRGTIGVGVSKKIDDPRRKMLKEELFSEQEIDELQQAAGPCGITLRTNAQSAPDEEIRAELSRLSEEMKHLLLTAPYRQLFCVMHREPARWLTRMDSLQESRTDAIITDDEGLLREMNGRLKGAAALSGKLRFYRNPQISMHALFGLTRELGQALSRKVEMKSGANLIIEQTEALAVIDVNSAHFIKGRQKEEAVLKVNLEAARECARQIRLRNLSGMILIDFINMEKEESDEMLMKTLREAVRQDPVHTQVIDRTGLGLIELTRRKEEAPLSVRMYQNNA